MTVWSTRGVEPSQAMLMLQTGQQKHSPGLNAEGLEAQQPQVTPSGSLTSDRAVRRAPITSAASACPPSLSCVVGYLRKGRRWRYVVRSGMAGCTAGLKDLVLLQLVRGISLPVTFSHTVRATGIQIYEKARDEAAWSNSLSVCLRAPHPCKHVKDKGASRNPRELLQSTSAHETFSPALLPRLRTR